MCSYFILFLTDGGRELYFPTHYFYAEKHLVNHLIKATIVKDLDECEYRCYLDANCVSLNIRNKYTNGTHKCELNNSTHLEDEKNLKHNQLYHYRAADVSDHHLYLTFCRQLFSKPIYTDDDEYISFPQKS